MFDLPRGRPAIMGILNVTPDSFSDGGIHFAPEDAVRGALDMMERGADIIDVGGESTRPGSDPVSVEEEIRRVIPVVRLLRAEKVPVSIDTRKPEVARAALDEGARVVNDVSGFRDSRMIEACRPYDCSICIMHMLGTPETMQEKPTYRDVVDEVREWLIEQVGKCIGGGINRTRIWIDPGIGFGKTVEHNLQLLNRLDAFTRTGLPVLVGVSRKSFIGRVLGSQAFGSSLDIQETPSSPDLPSFHPSKPASSPLGPSRRTQHRGEGVPLATTERLEGGLAAQVLAQAAGARIIRTHDVLASRRGAEMAAAILGATA